MNDPPDLIERVRRWVAQSGQTPGPPTTASTIEIAEAELGFKLPPLLVRLYSEVGDGQFGPEYTLMPMVDGAAQTIVGDYHGVMANRDDSGFAWPAGVIPILDWGCGMYAAVDCTVDSAPVRLYEPNGLSSGSGWHEAWFTDTATLDEWLEAWLSGAAWFSEDADPDQVHEPAPWDEVRVRLADRKPLREPAKKDKPSPHRKGKKRK
ncbi:SMI1/KNR4 family protein SUKH-1 [Stackebrandtia endophytica]|uniref:SMI1/KNR4 family protein SUKH-1 n=1 Tax=Stackebrandtia endophytica TaxID=1496996 RepID=A0A543AQF0_9ACTN|nr:SMI1/KNR4 family protein [Stackebrandtia endophytica]TQL74755.1 SMI1/KNR4 family protein SUKH-1 [Stackebrandtia endophytica]